MPLLHTSDLCNLAAVDHHTEKSNGESDRQLGHPWCHVSLSLLLLLLLCSPLFSSSAFFSRLFYSRYLSSVLLSSTFGSPIYPLRMAPSLLFSLSSFTLSFSTLAFSPYLAFSFLSPSTLTSCVIPFSLVLYPRFLSSPHLASSPLFYCLLRPVYLKKKTGFAYCTLTSCIIHPLLSSSAFPHSRFLNQPGASGLDPNAEHAEASFWGISTCIPTPSWLQWCI